MDTRNDGESANARDNADHRKSAKRESFLLRFSLSRFSALVGDKTEFFTAKISLSIFIFPLPGFFVLGGTRLEGESASGGENLS